MLEDRARLILKISRFSVIVKSEISLLSEAQHLHDTMQRYLSFLAAIAVANGSPVPQGVTENIAPPGGIPAGCMANYDGSFGIAVVTGTAMASGAAATQASDGQPAAADQISDGACLVETIHRRKANNRMADMDGMLLALNSLTHRFHRPTSGASSQPD